ncbi:hypothetical protein FSY75_24450 [Streptomyces sp. TR1341]|uniref:hypothetical protein n=1 Tax=Streptomyces TaxID=1883 RepID=UPI00138B117D|nr:MULTISPECIES: hypothetical protein [Streptomyces]NDK27552.1 hypothetical protein [Streptomyces sp. TR1341]WSI85492.1 hypothetical protein OG516_13525 [Streptomyces murinus]
MSDVFAVDLALDLSPAMPNAVLDDLRWHLGLLAGGSAAADEIADLEPLLAARGPAARIGGLLTGELVRAGDHWTLTARQEVHAELLRELESLAERLAFHATTEGVIGQVRFYEDEVPEMLVNRSGELARITLRSDDLIDTDQIK